jgi:hypothetical protein
MLLFGRLWFISRRHRGFIQLFANVTPEEQMAILQRTIQLVDSNSRLHVVGVVTSKTILLKQRLNLRRKRLLDVTILTICVWRRNQCKNCDQKSQSAGTDMSGE